MRKDADFAVDARVNLHFNTEHEEMKNLILEFADFLKEEALIIDISESSCDADTQKDVFESEDRKIEF